MQFKAGDGLLDTGFSLDEESPQILAVSAPANGTYLTGQNLDFTVTFTEAVLVSGTRLVLDIGGVPAYATYLSGSGTASIVYRYTLQAGDIDADGIDIFSPLQLNGGSLEDAAGNPAILTYISPNTASVLVDERPTVTITSGVAATTNTSPIPVTVTFSEAVTGFAVGDLTLGNGTASNFAGAGTTYTFDFTPSGQGTVTVDVAAGVAIDASTNGNLAATQFSRVFDSAGPSVTVNQGGLQADPTNDLPVTFTVVFSEAIAPATFTTADITQNGTATGITWALATSNNITWTLTATAITGDGTLIPSIAINRVTDVVGNNNAASTTTDSTVTYDTTAPTVTITSTASDPTFTAAIPITVTFSQAVTGFTAGDITLAGATLSAFAGSGTTYTFTATAGAYGTVTVDVAASVAQDAAGNNNSAAAQFSIDYTNSLALTVTALYPNNGANWNDYVKHDQTTFYNANDVACAGNEVGVTGCIHGGEKRKVVITGIASCTGLTLTDQLGAFDWICSAASGTATFYSVGFKTGKGLRDLVDATAFKQNKVTLTGNALGESALATWWTNPVVALPDNSAAAAIRLDGVNDGGNDAVYAEGTIFTLAASRTTRGYNLNRNKLGIVTLSGATLTYSGSATNNCDDDTAENNGSNDYRCIVSAGSQNFLWIEVDLDGEGGANDAGYGVMIGGVTHSRIHQTKVRRGDNGFGTRAGTTDNLSTDLTLNNSGWGLELGWHGGAATQRNVFIRTRSTNMSSDGITFNSNASANVLSEVAAFNNGVMGIYFVDASSNVVTRAVLASNTNYGTYIDTGSSFNTLSFLSAANNNNEGIVVAANGTRGTIHQAVATNNNNGFRSGDIGRTPSNFTLSQLVSTNNAYGINHGDNADNFKFSGNIIVGNNSTANCEVTATGTNKGLVDGTCTNTGADGSSSYPVGALSDGVLRTGRTLASAFVGKLTSDEATNTSDTNGTAAHPGAALFDWTGFANFFRGWGRDGAAFPNSNHRSRWTAGTGRIWDFSLASTDTVITNNSRNGATANEAFVNGEACPMAIHGDVATTDQRVAANTYLLNAMEIIVDGIGDDDGLCESSEACIYAPNFGAYQGTGGYTSNTCLYQDDGDAAAVDNVTMYAYDSVVESGYAANENFNGAALGADFTSVYANGFGVLQSGKWEVTPPTNTVPLGDRSNTSEVLATAAMDFTGKQAVTEVTQMSGTGTEVALGVQIDADNGYAIYIDPDSGNLYCDVGVAAVWDANACAVYSATNHRFLRIRHDSGGGTINWEVSANGFTWTTLRSQAPDAALPVTALHVRISAGAYMSTATPGVATFEQVYVE